MRESAPEFACGIVPAELAPLLMTVRNEPAAAVPSNAPWWRHLERYHVFVLVVAALGWVFDCMDQQLFAISRSRAMAALAPGEDPLRLGGYATSIFLVGWAAGGLFFGMLGDRIGRARTMLITILVYSVCTGLSALSTGFWDFAGYRFLTGLGVGGEFAVGVALVAEVMPERARAGALGVLQSASALGNIAAASMGMFFAGLEAQGVVEQGQSWRWLFVVGSLPALLALAVRTRLREPQRWLDLKASGRIAQHSSFTFGELLAAQPWRRHAILGLLLACTGVIGLWGIGFFMPELTRGVLTAHYTELGIPAGEIGPKADRGASWVQLVLQCGAFTGMLAFSWITQRIGRRRALALAFTLGFVSTVTTFWFFRELGQVWLVFLMGFGQFGAFAVYTIYLPELFPTHLRSTGTSFCYNVGRFAAAFGPSALAWLKTDVYAGHPDALRLAGITMSAVFLLGLLVVPFAPETRGKPLPD